MIVNTVVTAFHPRVVQPLGPDAIRSDKAALEATVKEVQAKALGAMSRVQRAHDEKQKFVKHARQGPAGWVWSPIVPQGRATAQVGVGDGWS